MNMNQSKFNYNLVILVIAGCLLRAVLSLDMKVINVDAIDYFRSGTTLPSYFENLSTFWSPLYPILCIILNYLTMNIELSGKIVSVISGTALLIVIYCVTDRLFNRFSALLSVAIIAFFPAMIYYSTFITPEMTYLLIYYLAILKFLDWIKNFSFKNALFLGIFCAACYLTRPEGFMLFLTLFFVGITVIILNCIKLGKPVYAPIASLIIFFCVFALLSAPYIIKVKNEIGIWSISPRSGANIALSSENFEEKIFSLNEDTNKIKGFDYYTRTNLFNELKERPQVIEKKYKTNLIYFIYHAIPNLFINKIVLSVFFIGLIISFIILRKQNEAKKYLFILSLAAPIVIMPLYLIEIRSQIYIVPICVILSSVGFGSLLKKICTKDIIGRFSQNKRLKEINWGALKIESKKIFIKFTKISEKNLINLEKIFFKGAILILIVAPTYFYYLAIQPFFERNGNIGIEQKDIGLWLKNSEIGENKVMARKPWVAFYSGNEHIPFPFASSQDIIRYAKKNSVKYLVVDELITTKVRPGISNILLNDTENFTLYYDNLKSGEKNVKIFLLNK